MKIRVGSFRHGHCKGPEAGTNRVFAGEEKGNTELGGDDAEAGSAEDRGEMVYDEHEQVTVDCTVPLSFLCT